MITDVRTYNLVPRELPKYVKLFEEVAMPIQRRHGLNLIVYLVSEIGLQHQVLHIWSYDNLADMEEKRAARNADPEWAEYQEITRGLLTSQENRVMRPSAFSPIR